MRRPPTRYGTRRGAVSAPSREGPTRAAPQRRLHRTLVFRDCPHPRQRRWSAIRARWGVRRRQGRGARRRRRLVGVDALDNAKVGHPGPSTLSTSPTVGDSRASTLSTTPRLAIQERRRCRQRQRLAIQERRRCRQRQRLAIQERRRCRQRQGWRFESVDSVDNANGWRFESVDTPDDVDCRLLGRLTLSTSRSSAFPRWTRADGREARGRTTSDATRSPSVGDPAPVHSCPARSDHYASFERERKIKSTSGGDLLCGIPKLRHGDLSRGRIGVRPLHAMNVSRDRLVVVVVMRWLLSLAGGDPEWCPRGCRHAA